MFVDLTADNLAAETLCCIIRTKKPHPGVECKRQWLAERLKEGHVFRKLEGRATVFIEYAPLEKAWTPIVGENYFYVYCLWTEGENRGKGYGKALLESCLEDARRALDEKKTYETWEEGFLQILHAVRENKPFILNVYRCVSRERVERYLSPLTDRLLLNVVEERAAGMSVRPEDKEWIARVYAYILIGVMLDWIAGEMQEDPTVLVHRLAMVIHGNVTSALGRFEANGGLLSKQSE